MQYSELFEASSSIVLYHGTRHNFEKFSTEFSGTGQGFDAFGFGIYFTEDINVAKIYGGMLGTPNSKCPKAVPLIYQVKIFSSLPKFLNCEKAWKGQSSFIKSVIPSSNKFLDPTNGRELKKNEMGKWYWVGSEDFSFSTPKEARGMFLKPEQLSGKQIYDRFSRHLGGNKNASNAFKALGIPGLRYLDEESGKYNFVIWDTSIIQIERIINN